jgi:CHASE2 domain-containing sensor protein
MTPHVTTTVTALKVLILLLGGLITYFTFKAYRRTRSPALRALTLGLAVITLGALLAGIVDRIVPVDPSFALLVESVFTTGGFAIILYSLYVD